MQETAEQYTARILSNVSNSDPLVSMAGAAAKLRELVRGVSADVARKRPASGKWSVLEIAAHLADVEIAVGFRARFILGSDDGVPIVPFDQDRWLSEMKYNERDMEQTLRAFEAARENNLALYRSLSEAQWNKYGMHAERGKETVRRVVTLCAGHDINHLQQIEQILGKKVAAAS